MKIQVIKKLVLMGLTNNTKIGRGIRAGKFSSMIPFKKLESNTGQIIKEYNKSAIKNAPRIFMSLKNDKKFLGVLNRFAQKMKLGDVKWENMSEEEIIQLVLQKSGVGPCKFAQIISSDEAIMSKLSPKLQTVIKKTQSENPFSRTLSEAQAIVDSSFNKQSKFLPLNQGNKASPIKQGDFNTSGIKLEKALSAGTVGEAYLAKTSDGKEVIVKMIKENVDQEQLALEETIFKRIISEIAPDEITKQKHINMLKNLYSDWKKELNFKYEYEYNKLLQKGAKRYKVADIKEISGNNRVIIMDKADGIQMNHLMKMLKAYKENPALFAERYADEIKANPWLASPEKVIADLPECITKAFDEMCLFMRNGKTAIMHGDPHMGNYFITTNEKGKLIPTFIDTGNCVTRDAKQIKSDLSFLTNYFVGNSKGVAKYFVEQCERDTNLLAKKMQTSNLLPASKQSDDELVNKLAAEIQKTIFGKNQNITDVEAVQKTIMTILEKYGLSMRPEAATALKAQMQFYTGITEAAALSGNKINVGTIVKDIPNALYYMVKSKSNPFSTIKEASKYMFMDQEQASKTMYQFLTKPSPYQLLFSSSKYNTDLALHTLNLKS